MPAVGRVGATQVVEIHGPSEVIPPPLAGIQTGNLPTPVEDLLRAVARHDWIDDLDFAALERLPADQVGDLGQQRRGDGAWRVRFRGRWLYLLVLLEFQSRSDAAMALRMLEYTALLYRELGRRGELGAPGGWPPVLPVVVYNGDAPWTAALQMRDLIGPHPVPLAACQPAQRSLLLDEQRLAVDDLPLGNLVRAVAGFEQSRTPAEFADVAASLRGWLAGLPDTELGRAFASWLQQLVARVDPQAAVPPAEGTLEEANMGLLERMAEWPEQLRREGVAKGRREGVEQQRGLLARQAALRFGPETGARVDELLAGVERPERLAAAAEWIVGAHTAAELTARLAAETARAR